MRVVFMGTPDFAVPTLRALADAGHGVAAVYTRAPKPAGRGQGARQSPVHRVADELGIPVVTPSSLRDAGEAARFTALGAEVVVVVAYGLLLPKPILDAPKFGCLNLHGSLLPRWRGAAPIQRAVMAGDERGGVMVMRMDEGLDTGPVGLVDEIAIPPQMTAGGLHDEMMGRGAALMVKALDRLARGELVFVPQAESGATYAKKLEKGETRIDWTRPAREIHNHIRGLSPFPGAWFELRLGTQAVRVRALASELVAEAGAPGRLSAGLTVACGSGAVRLTLVQREGKAAMSAESFLRGAGALPDRAD